MSDKQSVREAVWDRLETTGQARFPFPVNDRIPNFAGSDMAAERVQSLDVWEGARVLKANPDYAQFPVRVAGLETGVDLFVAVPRLTDERCFIHLDGMDIQSPSEAATLGGIDETGSPVFPEAVPDIDLIIVGSVAVTENGARIGKGEGYSDLEYAILRECGLVDESTPVLTTVHEHQVVDEPVDTESHDVPLDWIVTPERVIETETPQSRPIGVDWSLLSYEQRDAMPILDRLATD